MTHEYHVDIEKLRSAREEAGFTVSGLAYHIGMEAYQLALVENRIHVPALTTLRNITLALNIPAYTVIEWSHPPAWNGPHEYSSEPEYIRSKRKETS